MGDKGEGGVKNIKKWVTSFMDGPISIFDMTGTPERYTRLKFVLMQKKFHEYIVV